MSLGSAISSQVSVPHFFFFFTAYSIVRIYRFWFIRSPVDECLACFQSCHQVLVTSYSSRHRVLSYRHLHLRLKCLTVNLLGGVRGRLEPRQPNSKRTYGSLKATGFSYKPRQPLSHLLLKVPPSSAPLGFLGKGNHLPSASHFQPSRKTFQWLLRSGNQFQLSSGSLSPKRRANFLQREGQ